MALPPSASLSSPNPREGDGIMEHLRVELVKMRMNDLRAEADRERLVHLARPDHRAARAGQVRRRVPSMIRRVLALR